MVKKNNNNPNKSNNNDNSTIKNNIKDDKSNKKNIDNNIKQNNKKNKEDNNVVSEENNNIIQNNNTIIKENNNIIQDNNTIIDNNEENSIIDNKNEIIDNINEKEQDKDTDYNNFNIKFLLFGSPERTNNNNSFLNLLQMIKSKDDYNEEGLEQEKYDDENNIMNEENYYDNDWDYYDENNEYSKLSNTEKRKIDKKLSELKKSYNTREHIYYKKLSNEQKYDIDNKEKNILIQHKIINEIPMRFRILNSNMDNKYKALALQKLDILNNMSRNDSDYDKLYRWMDTLMKIPFNQYDGLNIVRNHNPKHNMKEIHNFIYNTKDILNNAVYGHTETKDQIIRYIAQWIVNENSNGLILGIHGAMGCGKTTLVKDGICKAFQVPFVSIPLGGLYDVSHLDGHGYTYTGSMHGKIIQSLIDCKCANPVFYFDELDKIGKDSNRKDGSIENLMIHLTDPLQNNEFTDKYFTEFPINLSKSIMIFTYNDENLINPILRDRMITIHIKPYSLDDKINIANLYLLPSLEKQFCLNKIIATKSILKKIILASKNNEGIRDIRRMIEYIISNINLKIILENIYSDEIELSKFAIAEYITAYNKTKINEDNEFMHSLYS